MNGATTEETLRLIKQANTQQLDHTLQKAWQESTGLVYYDLEAPAKTIYPVITPLRNKIPRVKGGGDTATKWKAILKVNKDRQTAGVSEGNRGGTIQVELKDYLAGYAGLGLEDFVTFEAEYAAENFDDAKARAVEGLLRATFIEEENALLGANNSVALGVTPTPTVATSVTGGSIGATVAVHVSCIALTHEGFRLSSIANGVLGKVTRTNADASIDIFGGFSGQISVSANVTTGAGSANSVTGTVTAVTGAFAYAWFWGPTSGAAQLLGAITSINSVLIKVAVGTGTQDATDANLAADNSKNALLFDGLLYIMAGLGPEVGASTSGSYTKTLATGVAGTGTPLTADGAGGIVEIDDAFQSFWDNHNLGPDEIWVNAQQLLDISKTVLAGGSAPLFRFMGDVVNPTNISQLQFAAGMVIGTYLNKFTMAGGQLVPIRLHPNVVPGTIMFLTWNLPYPLSNVAVPMRVKTRREYYQLEWPITKRRYEYGVYVDEVLQHYFPPSIGYINNVGKT